MDMVDELSRNSCLAHARCLKQCQDVEIPGITGIFLEQPIAGNPAIFTEQNVKPVIDNIRKFRVIYF